MCIRDRPWPAAQDMEQPKAKKRKGALKCRRVPKTSALGTIEPEDTSGSIAPLASSSKKESVHPRAEHTGKAKEDTARWRSLSKSETGDRKIVPLGAGPATTLEHHKGQSWSSQSWWPQHPVRGRDRYGQWNTGFSVRFTLEEVQGLRTGHQKASYEAVRLSKSMAKLLRFDKKCEWTKVWEVENRTRASAVEIYLIVQNSYSRRGRRFELSSDCNGDWVRACDSDSRTPIRAE